MSESISNVFTEIQARKHHIIAFALINDLTFKTGKLRPLYEHSTYSNELETARKLQIFLAAIGL
jgi:hypothetical protein